MKTANIILFFIFVTLFTASAQNGTIKGRIYDAMNNEPLPFVNIIIKDKQIGSVSDLDGNFIFTGLEPGYVTLEASLLGYKKAFSPDVLVSNSNPAFVDISMEQTTMALEEVAVVATRYSKIEESPVSYRNITLSEIENNPGSNRDITKVIQSFPGVGSTVSFRNDILIRGGGPSESRFYLDGVEIPNINHFATQGSSGGPVGIINADFISSVNYFSGAFPANRGNALSGVFEFAQKDGNKEKTKFRTVVGASELSLTADGPIGEKSSFILSARQSYLQFLFDAIGLPFLPNFNDFQLKSRTRIDDKNEITVVGLGSIDRFKLNLGIEELTEEQQYILDYLPVNEQWTYALGTVYKHFRENSYQTIVLSRNMLNNVSYKYLDNDENNDKLLDYESQEIENKLRVENTTRLEGYKINAGFSFDYVKYNNNTSRLVFTDYGVEQLDYDSYIEFFRWAVFGQVSRDLMNNRLNLSMGFRADANSYSNSMANLVDQLSPRFSASYRLADKVSLNANSGCYYQLPAYTTLGYRDAESLLVNKNNELKYISVDHYIAGVEYDPRDFLIFTLEGFYKNYRNYPFSVTDSISLANKGGDFGTFGDEEVISTSKGRAYGAEFLARTNYRDKFNLLLSYTLVRSEFTDRNDDYAPSSWDSRHLLTLTSTRKFSNNWSAGIKWRFVGGLPYTPYDLELSAIKSAWDIQGRPYYDYTRLNLNRLTAYHQLDIRIDKYYFFNKWSLMLYIDIQNLYNFKADQPDYYIRETNPDGSYKVISDNGVEKYVLKPLSNSAGTVLPTVGIMVEF